MNMLLRATAFGLAGIFLVVGCGGDDTKTESDPSNVGGQNDMAGDGDGDGDTGADLKSSCLAFCDAQAECLRLTDAACRADCDTQVAMLSALDCAAEGAAENHCITKLSCEELQKYGQGRREHAECGAAARDYFDACTAGESAECTAMCERQKTCSTLAGSQGACEEGCLLHQANLDYSGGTTCGDRFIDFVKCLAQASCDDLGTLSTMGSTPQSCTSAEAAMNKACG
jgi:hypothetical protein